MKLPSFVRRQEILTILHEFGLGNVAADAASRDHKMRIFALCASLNIRPVQVPVPPSVVLMVERTAAYTRHLTEVERMQGKACSNNEDGDGPTFSMPIDGSLLLWRDTPASRQRRPAAMALELSPDSALAPDHASSADRRAARQLLFLLQTPEKSPHAHMESTPPTTDRQRPTMVDCSPGSHTHKRHRPRVTPPEFIMVRTPPTKQEPPEMQLPSSSAPAAPTRRSPRKRPRLKRRNPALGAGVANTMLSAYADMPQYAINPVNMSSFGA